MSNEEYIKSIFRACPLVEADLNRPMVRFLAPVPLLYAIEATGADPVVTRYRGGDSLRRYTFRLVAQEHGRTDVEAHFEALADWFDEKSHRHALPPMEGGEPRFLRVLACGHGETEEGQTVAVFSIQCELIYYKKARM